MGGEFFDQRIPGVVVPELAVGVGVDEVVGGDGCAASDEEILEECGAADDNGVGGDGIGLDGLRDGKRQDVAGFFGTRDRSWGIRPVGARDMQEGAPPQPGQFFWIWSPCNFPSGSFFFHTNDDGAGEPWNRRAVWAPEGVGVEGLREIKDCGIDIDWKSGTRHAKSAVVTLRDPRGERQIVFEPQYEFYMNGLGYGHPSWGHGANKGQAIATEREDLRLADVNPGMPHTLHVQAISKVTYQEGGRTVQVGRGVLEQLALGPHAPSGFKQMLDMAP